MNTAVDPKILTDGDVVYYYNYDQSQFLIDQGTVKGNNLYVDGVTVHGDGWKQYVGKWFICKVERNGQIIFQQEEAE
jgi:hypothetical protein